MGAESRIVGNAFIIEANKVRNKRSATWRTGTNVPLNSATSQVNTQPSLWPNSAPRNFCAISAPWEFSPGSVLLPSKGER